MQNWIQREEDLKHNITHSPSLSKVVRELATDYFPLAPYVNDTVDRTALATVLAYLHKAGTNALFELAVLEPEDGQKGIPFRMFPSPIGSNFYRLEKEYLCVSGASLQRSSFQNVS